MTVPGPGRRVPGPACLPRPPSALVAGGLDRRLSQALAQLLDELLDVAEAELGEERCAGAVARFVEDRQRLRALARDGHVEACREAAVLVGAQGGDRAVAELDEDAQVGLEVGALERHLLAPGAGGGRDEDLGGGDRLLPGEGDLLVRGPELAQSRV